MKMNEYMERTEQVVLHTYNRFPVVFEKGEGVHLYDTEGKEYLDFGAGIAVFALGYHYADYDQALKDQIDKVIHTSNLFYNVPMMEAAEKLVKCILEHKDNKKNVEEESSQEKSMIDFFENKMKDILGSKVVIKNKKNNKGKIEIEYYSKDELERIIDLIQSIKE